MIKIILALCALNAVLIILSFIKQFFMANELEELRANVAKDLEVDQSAITLLNGLKARLDKAIASGNMGEVKTLSDQIGSSTQALADAVVVNTPAAEEPAV